MSKDEILSYLRNHYNEIKEFGVERIGLFGSYARGEANESSDIDILVKFESVSSKFKAYFGLKNYLEDRLLTKIDLCREEDIKMELKEEITESVIYA